MLFANIFTPQHTMFLTLIVYLLGWVWYRKGVAACFRKGTGRSVLCAVTELLCYLPLMTTDK